MPWYPVSIPNPGKRPSLTVIWNRGLVNKYYPISASISGRVFVPIQKSAAETAVVMMFDPAGDNWKEMAFANPANLTARHALTHVPSLKHHCKPPPEWGLREELLAFFTVKKISRWYHYNNRAMKTSLKTMITHFQPHFQRVVTKL